MDGLLVLNKPRGITSREVVDRAEAWFPGVRIGHAGTLDPLATGVLVLALGRATRLIEYVQQMDKTYVAGVRLGAVSDTDDAAGPVRPVADARAPTGEELTAAVREFVGRIEQVPPAFSAAHVEGRRAYALARKGKAVELTPRAVHVYRLEVLHYDYPELDLVVDCGKGTYVRALARDLGRRLGCGAYLTALTRTRIGPFTLDEALDPAQGADEARLRLLPIRTAVSGLPTVSLSADQVRSLRHGQRLPWPAEPRPGAGDLAVLGPDGELVAVARWSGTDRLLVPHKVIAAREQG